jgi:hypothetical protein
MFSAVFTLTAFCLSLALLLLVLRRKLHQRLTAFSFFVVMFVVREAAGLVVRQTSSKDGLAWAYIYWTSELALSAMYLLIVAEISKRFFREYPSIRRNASRLLGVAAVALLLWIAAAVLRYAGHPRLFFMIVDQRLELTITILLLLLMAIGAYYRLTLPPLYRFVLIGIGIYASVQVVANQIELQYKGGPDSLFDYLRRVSFTISVIVWTYAVWRWAAPPTTPAELIPQSKYDALSPRVHDRLQEVNLKLANLANEQP